MSNKLPLNLNRLRGCDAPAGVALLTALGMLALFAMLGTAFIGYMTIERQKVGYELRIVRANAMAEGGIRAAIGEIQASLRAGQSVPPELAVQYPVYGWDREAGNALTPRGDRVARAHVNITDESARVNLNQAPTLVLQAILGVDGNAARKIRAALPREDSGVIILPTAERRWLTTVDDLVTRNLIDLAVYDTLDANLLTVYSVLDNGHPGSHINVNSAPAQVLAAALNLTPDAAQKVVEARAKAPFQSLGEVSAAAGKPPESFNMPPSAGAPDAMPAGLALQSRCFRIRSVASLADRGENGVEANVVSREVEAVVYFPEDAAPVVQFWSMMPGQ